MYQAATQVSQTLVVIRAVATKASTQSGETLIKSQAYSATKAPEIR
jgi:hypothetical protein